MMPPVNLPTPALVTQRAAQRLPRWALMLLCAAYLLPGQFGREPWKNADITAFGYMSSLAEGRSPWTAPALAGLLISVEPLIDMGRTALNVSGAITAGTVVSRVLGETDLAVFDSDAAPDLDSPAQTA